MVPVPSLDYTPGIVTTWTGRAVNVLQPKPEMFDLADIAHGLSLLCRYTGQLPQFYSVAEHAWHVSTLVGNDPETQLVALLHDAAEAYLGDLSAPIKSLPEFSFYRFLEERLQQQILTRFNLPTYDRVVIKKMDQAIRVNERHVLRCDWLQEGDQLLPVVLQCWSPQEAEQRFLDRFHDLEAQYRNALPGEMNARNTHLHTLA